MEKTFVRPRRKPELTWEVLSYDKATGILQLRDDRYGNFAARLSEIKDRWQIFKREVPNAEQS